LENLSITGMTVIQKKYIESSDGISLYYETYYTESKSPTIFLLHGVGGDLDAWQFIRDNLLEKGFSCIAMDIRGHGYSGHPRSFKSYEIEHFVQDFIDIIDAENLSTVILIGHSLGAVLATHIALAYKDRLEKLVLISPSYIPPPYLHLPILKQISTTLIAILSIISPPPMKPWHSTYPVGKFHKDFELYGLVRTITKNSLRSYLLSSKETLRHELQSKLKEIKLPTLILSGDKDSIFPIPIAEFIHSQIPQSKFEVIKDGNHVLVVNNVNEVSEAIYNFIK
jgi:pimeloyl-ACP methyl ester carboxylesterase